MEQSGLFKKILVILSLVSLLLFVAIYYVYRDIRIKNETILTVEQDLFSKNTRHEYLTSLQKLFESIEPKINKVESTIVPSGGEVAFIEDLEALARGLNIDITIDSLNLATDPKIASSTLSTLRVRAKYSGAWSNMYRFISEIESLKNKIKINRITLSNQEELTATRSANTHKNWQGVFEISVLEYK
jgi:organic radical activating enzyme